MTPTETAAQLHLAADILETGHPFEWRNEDFSEWHPANGNSVHHFMDNCVIRPILARPPYRAKLHNPNGLTAEQVGVGYRLAIVNEALLQDFYEFWRKGSKSWSKGCFNTKAKGICTYRLPLSVPWPKQSKPFTLPIQTLAQDQVELTSEMQEAASQVLKEEMQGLDPYADLKKAHAEGKVIQINVGPSKAREWYDMPQTITPAFLVHPERYRIKPNEPPPWIEWHGGECPLKDEEVEEWEIQFRDGDLDHAPNSPQRTRWSHHGTDGDIIAYRVLKWSKKMQLEPEDVPPQSVLLSSSAGANGTRWMQVLCVKAAGVEINGRACIPWTELKTHWQINRSIPLTGKWNPNAWEACKK